MGRDGFAPLKSRIISVLLGKVEKHLQCRSIKERLETLVVGYYKPCTQSQCEYTIESFHLLNPEFSIELPRMKDREV